MILHVSGHIIELYLSVFGGDSISQLGIQPLAGCKTFRPFFASVKILLHNCSYGGAPTVFNITEAIERIQFNHTAPLTDLISNWTTLQLQASVWISKWLMCCKHIIYKGKGKTEWLIQKCGWFHFSCVLTQFCVSAGFWPGRRFSTMSGNREESWEGNPMFCNVVGTRCGF